MHTARENKGSPSQCARCHPMRPCWLPSHVRTRDTCCPCRPGPQHTQHNPAHVRYMSRRAPVVPPRAHMTSQRFGLQCTRECTALPSLLPLARLARSQDIARCPFGSGSQRAHARVQNTTQPAPIGPPPLTGHCTMSLWVWLAARTREGAKHHPTRPHWPTFLTHRTLDGVPIGLASQLMHARVQNSAQPAPISPAFACTQHCMAPLWVWLAARARDGAQHCPAPSWVSLSRLCGHHSCPSTYCCISLHITSTLNK